LYTQYGSGKIAHQRDSTSHSGLDPGQDADDLARLLADAAVGGFETKVLVNCPSHEVRRGIELLFAASWCS
jgi:hypothetical protein